MKQTGTVNGNEFLRRRLGEDKNRTVKVDISLFMEKKEHDEIMAKQSKRFKFLFISALVLSIIALLQAIIDYNLFPFI